MELQKFVLFLDDIYQSVCRYQCCGSGSGFWRFFDPWIQDKDPGSRMEKSPEPGSGMNIPDLNFKNLVPVLVLWVENTQIL
jgi:hypothetical protein